MMAVDKKKMLADMIQEATALWKQKKRDEALAIYSKIAPHHLNHSQMLHNLSVAAYNQGKHKRAILYMKRIVELNPKDTAGFTNLGAAYKASGRIKKAIEAYRSALKIDASQPGVYSNMGNAFKSQKDYDRAEKAFRRAISLQSDFWQAHTNLSNLLIDRDRIPEALDVLEDVMFTEPEFGKAYAQYGRALATMDKNDAAAFFYRKALELDPKDDSTWLNYSQNLKVQKRMDESLECLEECLALNPTSEYGHYHFGLFSLLSGDLKRGFHEYQWRWSVESFPSPKRPFPQKYWKGQSLQGKKILVWGEQGVGEEIMFSHLIKDLQEEGAAECSFEADHRLVPLFQRSYPDVKVFARKVNPPDFVMDKTTIDYHSAIGSTCRAFRTRFEKFPKHEGYLVPDEKRVTEFKKRYDKMKRKGDLKVGISWKSLNKTLGAPKTVTLADWEDILKQKGAFFVNLQYGDCTEDLALLKEKTGLEIYDDPNIDLREDLDGLAAQISTLDLVITTSNVTAHLAGALGIPALVLLPHVPLWHWFLGREGSPWYPSLTFFRQYKKGDWEPVLRRIAVAFEKKRKLLNSPK
ncbi:MAG: tetratricopeptide repeat protein [Alphaproteobacteria bacterium]